MTQEIIVWALLAGLVGLVWVMALAVLGDTHHSRQGSASPEHGGGYEPHQRSPQQSKVAA